MAAPERDAPPRIDWLPEGDIDDGLPGRIGMTVLPGKNGASVRYPGRVYRADLEDDLAALRDAGVGRLVLLVDDRELVRWGDAAIVDRAARHGVRVDRFPMPDGHPPAGDAEMDAILDAITEGRNEANVAVACMGGVGRTGTVVACALIAAGWDADRAIARVREVRHPQAVETSEQERFVRGHRSRVRE